MYYFGQDEADQSVQEFGRKHVGRPKKSRGKSHKKSHSKKMHKKHGRKSRGKSHKKSRMLTKCSIRKSKKLCGAEPNCGWRKKVGCVRRSGAKKGMKYEGPTRFD